jgi:hypothetical protein
VGADVDSLLVLTGVSSPADLLAVPAAQRPSYVGADLGALLDPHPPTRLEDAAAACGTAVVHADPPHVRAAGEEPASAVDVLRALCGLVWAGRLDVEVATALLI